MPQRIIFKISELNQKFKQDLVDSELTKLRVETNSYACIDKKLVDC